MSATPGDSAANSDTAARVEMPAELAQFGVGVADTPQGQRLVVTMALQLPADAAKQLADAIGKATSGMSSSGIVVASSIISGNGQPH